LVKTMLSMVGRKISVSSLPWECKNAKKCNKKCKKM
jgi:hypothetical protein